MRRREDEQMWRWEDVKMWRWEDVKMRSWKWGGVKMRRCEDEQMWRWEDVKMSRCEDEKIWRWADVKMRRREDEQMWRWEDEIETPTIGRTLCSDALGKKNMNKRDWPWKAKVGFAQSWNRLLANDYCYKRVFGKLGSHFSVCSHWTTSKAGQQLAGKPRFATARATWLTICTSPAIHRILVATFVYRSMRNSWRRTLRTLARSVGPCRPTKCTNGGSRRWGLLTAIRQCRDWGPNSQVVVHCGHEPSNSSCLLPNIVSDQHREKNPRNLLLKCAQFLGWSSVKLFAVFR